MSSSELALSYHLVSWAAYGPPDSRIPTRERFQKVVGDGRLLSSRAQGITGRAGPIPNIFLHPRAVQLGWDRFIFLSYGNRYQGHCTHGSEQFGFAFRTTDLLSRGAAVLRVSLLETGGVLDSLIDRVCQRHDVDPDSVNLRDPGPPLRRAAIDEVVREANAALERSALRGEAACSFLETARRDGFFELWVEDELPLTLAVERIVGGQVEPVCSG